MEPNEWRYIPNGYAVHIIDLTSADVRIPRRMHSNRYENTLCCTIISVPLIGGPSAYRREGPTPTKGAQRGGTNPLRAPKGEGHYRFCNLRHLLIAICTLR